MLFYSTSPMQGALFDLKCVKLLAARKKKKKVNNDVLEIS